MLLVVAGAGITVKLGNAGIAFALSAVFTFSYMAHLLLRARHRSEQYVSLSWGVLAGLMLFVYHRFQAGLDRSLQQNVRSAVDDVLLEQAAHLGMAGGNPTSAP